MHFSYLQLVKLQWLLKKTYHIPTVLHLGNQLILLQDMNNLSYIHPFDSVQILLDRRTHKYTLGLNLQEIKLLFFISGSCNYRYSGPIQIQYHSSDSFLCNLRMHNSSNANIYYICILLFCYF